MRSLRWVGLMSSLVIVGVLGGLMAALPSEAATLTLDGAPINVSTSTTSCTLRSGFNACFDLAFTSPLTVNNKWIVFDCAAPDKPCGSTFTGRGKADVNDVSSCSTCTSDMLAMGGIGIKAKFPSSTGVSGTLVLRHTFNAASNASSSFYYALTQQGWFDPPLSENAVGDSVTLTATARHPSTNALLFSLGGFTKASIVSPTSPDSKVSFGISQTTPQLKGTCDTGSNKCNPLIEYVYTFTVKGSDLFVLTNSLAGGGATCGDTGNLPSCAVLIEALAATIGNIENEDKQAARNAGAVEGQLCQEPCIVIRLEGTPAASAEGKEFTFSATGPGFENLSSFPIQLDSQVSGELGVGIKVISNLPPDPPAADRTIIITGFPDDMELDQVKCSGGGTCRLVYDGSGNSKTKIGFVVTNLNTQLNALLHVH